MDTCLRLRLRHDEEILMSNSNGVWSGNKEWETGSVSGFVHCNRDKIQQCSPRAMTICGVLLLHHHWRLKSLQCCSCNNTVAMLPSCELKIFLGDGITKRAMQFASNRKYPPRPPNKPRFSGFSSFHCRHCVDVCISVRNQKHSTNYAGTTVVE